MMNRQNKTEKIRYKSALNLIIFRPRNCWIAQHYTEQTFANNKKTSLKIQGRFFIFNVKLPDLFFHFFGEIFVFLFQTFT